MLRSASTGALWAILGAVPIAVLIVWWLGTQARSDGAGFVLIYGVLLGALSLPFVAILGAAVGAAAHAIAVKRQLPLTPMVIGLPLLADFSIGVFIVVGFLLLRLVF